MEKKYIVVHTMFSENIIIFSAVLDHKTVAGDMNVVSAGFMDISIERGWDRHQRPLNIRAHCYGESKTLGIKSRPREDAILANILFKE